MKKPNKVRRTAYALFLVPPLMLGAAYAAVPLYDWFCRVTGYGGTTSVAAESRGEILDEVVTIRFDASTAPDMPWEFRPKVRTMEMRIGETGLMFYEAYNPTDETLVGAASYNVAPFSAGPYFAKIACFCFERQVLGPGERIDMPVTFFVDPEMVDDREAGGVRSITLSYTMHRSDVPAASAPVDGQAAVLPPADVTGGILTAEAAIGTKPTH